MNSLYDVFHNEKKELKYKGATIAWYHYDRKKSFFVYLREINQTIVRLLRIIMPDGLKDYQFEVGVLYEVYLQGHHVVSRVSCVIPPEKVKSNPLTFKSMVGIL